MIGFAIVVFFALIAILAPVIAPYPRTYLAPDADRFKVNSYSYALPANLTYSGPTLGPTTPLNDAVGSMWDINWNATKGIVYMNLLRYALGFNESPFRATQNFTVSFDVTQTFGVTPVPGLPLHAVYYIVPGKDYAINGTTGPNEKNGAVAFFTGNDFIAADPFNRTAFFNSHLDFTPTWTGQDPASGGNMLIAPSQSIVAIGLLTHPVGPYEYFYASDGNHTAIFEVRYVHAGYCPCAPPSGSLRFYANGSLSAPPFVYYNTYRVTQANDWRSGPGQGVFLPLANGTLEVVDVTGGVRAYVPLTLDGAPATVQGNIGYVQTQYPPELLLPLKSANAIGVGYFDLNSLQLTHEYVIRSPAWEPIGTPLSRSGNATYAAFYNPTNDTTFMVGVNETGSLLSKGQFQVYLPGRARSYFYAEEPKQVFVLAGNGKMYSVAAFGSSLFSKSKYVVPDLFTIVPPPGVPAIRYAGAFGGTLYGTLLSTQELNGIWTDPATGVNTVFQLTGTPRTPLPPGTYSSGSPYYWGTDFFGGDILTEWIYGTQVAFVVGLLAALFSVGIGTLVGVISGYYGKVIDTLLMRTTDVFLVLPFLPIVLVLISITAPSIWIIIMVIAVLGWPGIARVIRAQVLSLKERPFVDAARVSGASDLRLVFLHIAPNVLPFSFLYMSLSVGGAIITEAALSFLGFGDPTVTSWGGMLSNLLTFSGGLYAYWWLLPPGLGITFLSLGFYLIGRGFDEIINPRLRRR
jgi:peptide/nickel transport system permease protein